MLIISAIIAAVMKRLVYLVLKQSPDVFGVLDEIRKDGYNATVVSTESLHHALDDAPEDKHFFNLRHIEEMAKQESMLCLFVVDEDKVEHLKQVIRANTNHFTLVKGFMFSRPIEDFEGSI